MGRLLKKKGTTAKKKKRDGLPETPETNNTSKAEEKRAPLTLIQNRSPKKREETPKRPKKENSSLSGPLKAKYVDTPIQFLREVKVELKKVTWPSRKQTIGSTVVVIVLVMIISLFLGIVDMGLSSLIKVALN